MQPIDEGKASELGWTLTQDKPATLVPSELVDWDNTRKELRAYAVANGLNKAQVSRRFGISASMLSEWWSAKYRGNMHGITESVMAGLKSEEEQRVSRIMNLTEPDFVNFPTAQKVIDAMIYAQTAPSLALVTLGPGMGKTHTAKKYCATRPNAYRVVMRPSTQAVPAMLSEIGQMLGINAVRSRSVLSRTIGERLRRNERKTLLIVDEAQHLVEQSVNELRYLLDEYGVGLVLLGNEDVHTRFGGTQPRDGYGQLQRRIGMRIRQLKPTRRDIDEYVAAWKFADEKINDVLRAIGMKPGALGHIRGTLHLAAIAAMGRNDEITLADVKQAWMNRMNEEVAA